MIGIPCVTDCVIAELEKLGQRYRVALRYDLDFRIRDPTSFLITVHIGWLATLDLSAFLVRILGRMRMTAWFNASLPIVVTSWRHVTGN